MNQNWIRLLDYFPLFLLPILLLSACAPQEFPTGTFLPEARKWSITFSEDGSFTAIEDGKVVTSGTYSIHGNELTWESDSYCEALNIGKATYTWTFKNETLYFRVKGEDRCDDRLDAFENISYHRAP